MSTARGTWVPSSSRARGVRGGPTRDAVGGCRSSPCTGPVDVVGLPPAMARPATVVQRAHECGADGPLADALRELIG